MRRLVHCAHYCCKKFSCAFVDYGDLAMYSVLNGPKSIHKFSNHARSFVNGLIFVTQFGFCCVYFVFMADNTKQVVDHYHPGNGISQALWMVVFLVPVLAINTIRSLKGLTPFALVANVLFVVGFIVTFQYLFHDTSGVETLPAFVSFAKLPLFFGTVMFAFEGICMVLPIENRMYEPDWFIHQLGVLNTACLNCMLLYCAIGFFGYIRFGTAVHDVITLDLPTQWYYQSVKIMFVVAIWITYALMFHVPMDVIEKWLEKRFRHGKHWTFIYGTRYAIVLVTFILAEAIPHLGLFISLVGSVSCSALALILPPLIDLLCAYPEKPIFRYVTSVCVCAFGLLGFFSGTSVSIKEIIQAFQQ